MISSAPLFALTYLSPQFLSVHCLALFYGSEFVVCFSLLILLFIVWIIILKVSLNISPSSCALVLQPPLPDI